MNELLNKEQLMSVVPQDFRNATKGKVIKIEENSFELEVIHDPKGILIDNLVEFYSQTPNGVLYFESDVTKAIGNVLTVANPVKHRFLQRRKFTRINVSQKAELQSKAKTHSVTLIDLSAGGMKLTSKENVDIDSEYSVCVSLSDDQRINCTFQPIRIEKQESDFYTLSGRFKNMSSVDKMTLVQFCMKKKLENVNK